MSTPQTCLFTHPTHLSTLGSGYVNCVSIWGIEAEDFNVYNTGNNTGPRMILECEAR